MVTGSGLHEVQTRADFRYLTVREVCSDMIVVVLGVVESRERGVRVMQLRPGQERRSLRWSCELPSTKVRRFLKASREIREWGWRIKGEHGVKR